MHIVRDGQTERGEMDTYRERKETGKHHCSSPSLIHVIRPPYFPRNIGEVAFGERVNKYIDSTGSNDKERVTKRGWHRGLC